MNNRLPLTRPVGARTLRQRFGDALQRQRQVRGVTQGGLADLAGLSPKYVGEIERGEANVSIDLQERLCVALDWYPFELWVTERETVGEGPRTVLSASLQNIVQLAQTGVRTLDAMQAEATRASTPPKPKRGRPRGRLNALLQDGEEVAAIVRKDIDAMRARRTPNFLLGAEAPTTE